MIENKEIVGKERVCISFDRDILISTFNNNSSLDVLVTLSDNTDNFKVNGKLDLDKDYDMEGQTFESIDPKVVMVFTEPKSIKNMIMILQDAEELLISKYPKTKTRKG